MAIILIIVGLSLLVLVHELGHFFVARKCGIKVEEFGIGFPPRIFKKKRGETEWSINSIPFGGFVKLYGEQGLEEGKDKERSFIHQSFSKKITVILAGVTVNAGVGWLLLCMVAIIGAPHHVIISGIAPESPAAIAGVKANDVILSIQSELERKENPENVEAVIGVVEKSVTKKITVEVMRGKESQLFTLVGRINPPEGEGSLGVQLADVGIPQQGLWGGIKEGTRETISAFGMIIKGFGTFFAGLVGQGQGLKNVSGPIGIIGFAYSATQLGFVYFMNLIALISLNLTVLNLIPFPALDGGRALVLIIEKIKGNQLSLKTQTIINGIGFGILILLMVVVSVHDIRALF